ncbi:MAG: tetratricopeptide repeat protein [Candidatus Kapabacteria bacterium]|nr:tetratricopeptide repeat protein [Candidatus Kapabacteria bacterium]
MSTRPAPSFAVTAASLLREQKPVDAARLCASGLEYFPDYAAGYLLLSRAYSELGQPVDAELILEEARRRFPRYSVFMDQPEASEGEATAPAQELALTKPTSQPKTEEPLRAEPRPHNVESVLRIIESVPRAEDQPIIRSSSVRLIPGLEYTTLRFEGMRSRGRREIAHLSDPPAFRQFHTMRRTTRPTEEPKEAKKAVSLEELATRLEKARMPRQPDFTAPQAPSNQISGGPTVVTETIARIYMQQGSFDRAIEAFRVLQRAKPGQHTHFEQLIAECESARADR